MLLAVVVALLSGMLWSIISSIGTLLAGVAVSYIGLIELDYLNQYIALIMISGGALGAIFGVMPQGRRASAKLIKLIGKSGFPV